jgi:hypothetical protein
MEKEMYGQIKICFVYFVGPEMEKEVYGQIKTCFV